MANHRATALGESSTLCGHLNAIANICSIIVQVSWGLSWEMEKDEGIRYEVADW